MALSLLFVIVNEIRDNSKTINKILDTVKVFELIIA